MFALFALYLHYFALCLHCICTAALCVAPVVPFPLCTALAGLGWAGLGSVSCVTVRAASAQGRHGGGRHGGTCLYTAQYTCQAVQCYVARRRECPCSSAVALLGTLLCS